MKIINFLLEYNSLTILCYFLLYNIVNQPHKYTYIPSLLGLPLISPTHLGHHRDFPGGTSGKEFAGQCRRHKRCRFNHWVAKIPWRRKWKPTPLFLPRKFHRQRSLLGYSPWGHKKSKMIELTWHAGHHRAVS